MAKVLIVDDESFTRQGIIDMIPWDILNITEVKESFDGVDALKVTNTFEPDILLTDVRMPRMDGIELAFKIRNLYPKCAIIFMSGYSDKEYLKSAIKLKAISYVEKPIELDELQEAIKTAVLETLRTKTIDDNIENNISIGMISCDKDTLLNNIKCYFSQQFISKLYKSNFITILIKNIDSLIENKDVVITSLKNICTLHGFDTFITFQNEKQFLVHLFFPKDKKHLNNKETVTTLFLSLSNYLNTFTKHYICVGQTVSDITEVSNSYNTACKLINSTYFYDYGSIIFDDQNRNKEYIMDEKIYDVFEKFLLKEDKQNLIITLKRLFSNIRLHTCTSIPYVKDIYYKLLLIISNFSANRHLDISKFLDKNHIFEDIIRFNNIFETEQYLIIIIEKVFCVLCEKNSTNTPIMSILNYIHNNYSDPNLSLEKISKNTYLTPAYICVIFKEHTEKTVNKYITEYRLEKSKILLKDSNIKINDIASKVGYSDGNYFSKIFKKETDFTPSEFRRMLAK